MVVSFIIRCLILGVLSLTSSWAIAQNLRQIEEISGQSADGQTEIAISFAQPIGDPKVRLEEHGTFIQALIPNSHVLQPGKFFDGNSPLIRKIAAFQIDEQMAGIRMFVAKDAVAIKNAIKQAANGNRLILQIDHAQAGLSKTGTTAINGVPSADEVIQRTEVRGDISDPALKTHDDAVSVEPGGLAGVDNMLKDKLNVIASFLAIMLGGLVLFWKSRQLMSRRKVGRQELQQITMKTLASFPIAPKQKLTLVEVGHKKILLGISADQINYLTSIEDQHESSEPQQRSRQILEQLNHQALNSPGYQPSAVGQGGQVSQTASRPEKAPSTVSARRPKTRPGEAQKKSTQSVSAGGAARQPSSPTTQAKPPASNQQTRASSTPGSEAAEPKSIEDVTNLIRRKLKDLPKI
jgi:flagellar biogenesis protein FliO